MINHIVVTGCSLAHGLELLNRDDRYAMLVAKQLNCTLHDVSYSGCCNHIIVDYAIEKINDLIFKFNTDPQQILVIHSWTFADRIPVYWKDRDKFVIAKDVMFANYRNNSLLKKYPEILSDFKYDDSMNIFDIEMYYQLINDRGFFNYSFLKDVMLAEIFYKSLNIKVVHTLSSSLENVYLNQVLYNKTKNKKAPGGYRKIDLNNFKNHINVNNFLPTDLMSLCKSKKYPIGVQGHPLEQTHSDFSKLILDFVGKRYEIFSKNNN